MNELEEGWEVLVILKESLAPNGTNRCYVGQVQSCTDRGLRITSIDWILHTFSGADFWFPWSEIRGIEVYTDLHDPSHVDYGGRQSFYNGDVKVNRG